MALFKDKSADKIKQKERDSEHQLETNSVVVPRYSIGIDLGTTNSVMSYVDLQSDVLSLNHEVVAISQLTEAGKLEDKYQLPSFLYSAHEDEFAEQDLKLLWDDSSAQGWITGEWPRQLGAKTPMRLVSSVKSWLCQANVDPHSKFLPLQSPEDVEKVSPVRASTFYLQHLASAWNHQFSDFPIEQQEVVVTIPASFDPLARELTVKAIQDAGISRFSLLEEPQSAVYSWIAKNGESWRKQLKIGDVLLVIDIGGGTTDLSLLTVKEEGGTVELHRLAVGDHLLLGGDNMDLALAIKLQNKLMMEGQTLQTWQVLGLQHACRLAKEKLLNDPQMESIPIVVPSRGSKLMGATLKIALTQEDVLGTLVEGFFPEVGFDEMPKQGVRSALAKVALNYAQDAAITRHLAAFLVKHRTALLGVNADQSPSFLPPSVILLNGGVFKAKPLVDRVMLIINRWLETSGLPSASLLEGADLDLAVSKGASYFGFVRQGKGVRIRGGVASSYYLGIESSLPAVPGFTPPISALCLAPFGMEEGGQVSIPDQVFALAIGEPAQFRFFGSKTRRTDETGVLLESWQEGELEELPPVESVLEDKDAKPGERVNVCLNAYVTEIGTVEVEAVSVAEPAKHWKVSFDVRDRGHI